MIRPRRLLHPVADPVMVVIPVANLVGMGFGECRCKNGKCDGHHGQCLCNVFHRFPL